MGWLIVLIFRILIPLGILRWPLFFGLAALLLDLWDLNMAHFIGAHGLGKFYHAYEVNYQSIDKSLDLYYLLLEWYVFRHLFMRYAAVRILGDVLMGTRLIGVILFDLLKERYILFLAPNLFEYYFLLVVASHRIADIAGKERIRIKKATQAFMVAFLLLPPKLLQEYMVHIRQDVSLTTLLADIANAVMK